MTTRMDGFRKRTRRKFKKNQSQKGKVSIRNYLQKLEVGDKVSLTVEPAVQSGMYRPRFMGIIGTVVGKRGQCYQVEIIDISKKKVLVVHPVHLKKVYNIKLASTSKASSKTSSKASKTKLASNNN